jgi:hypothetical protein
VLEHGEIVKGYQVATDRYVTFTDDALKASLARHGARAAERRAGAVADEPAGKRRPPAAARLRQAEAPHRRTSKK